MTRCRKDLGTARARASVRADAARLVAELQGEAVPPGEGITADEWIALMGAIAAGTYRGAVPAAGAPRTAMLRVGISPRLVSAYLRAEPFLAGHYRACVTAGRRSRCPAPGIEEVLSDIAATPASAKAACALHGISYRGFLYRTQKDNAISERYLKAKSTQQELLRDELMGATWSHIDEIASSAEARQHTRAFNKAELAIRKLLPQRQRRAEARAFRAERVKDDPLAARRLRAKLRRPI
jgi:hypothetical protein